MVVTFCAPLHSQQETLAGPSVTERVFTADGTRSSSVAERFRERHLSANERAVEDFFKRNLPLGWYFVFDGKLLSLRRTAPIYILANARSVAKLNASTALLAKAKREGKKSACAIDFKIERHDDIAIVRQRVRLFKDIRAELENSYARLRIRHLCGEIPLNECARGNSAGSQAAVEYSKTRKILTDKLEVAPLYRIGTLYLYPLKNQCVTAKRDWYVTNITIRETDLLMPFEANDEIDIILRNMDQLIFWD